jgi:GTP cyclohydrolase I
MELPWNEQVRLSIEEMLETIHDTNNLASDHVSETPKRFVEALEEYISGYKQNPTLVLTKSFEESKYDQMIWVNDISFISHCIHHLAPFAGKMHFGYIPNGKIVGLSKIPRAFDILARRLQIQEQLSDQMVDLFNNIVKPQGCGIVIEATHFCMCARGIKKSGSYTRTVSLRGTFKSSEKTKQEFLDGAKRLVGSLL